MLWTLPFPLLWSSVCLILLTVSSACRLLTPHIFNKYMLSKQKVLTAKPYLMWNDLKLIYHALYGNTLNIPFLFFITLFLIFFNFIFIYWSVPGLSFACGLHIHWGMGIFSCILWTLSCNMQDLVTGPGIESGPLDWECRVLATGSPEVPKDFIFKL